MSKKILTTPIAPEDLADIKIGDMIYLTGHIVTCRDVPHRRVVEEDRQLPLDIRGGAILHAGPIIRKTGEKSFEMVSVGPTTSMRMEKFEREFIAKTGVRLIVGKGGMGEGTMSGCKEFGMPETLWKCRVKEFGPLIVSIDAHGNNLFEQNKVKFNEKKDAALAEILPQVGFIK